MDMLKQIFPLSFQAKSDIAALIINILIQIVVGAVVGFVLSILAAFPFIGFVFNFIGWMVSLYFTAGIVISLLDYFKVLK